MKRKPIRLLAALAAVALVGLGVVALAGGGGSSGGGRVDMHHGKVKFAKGQEQRILNAVAATNASTPNDQLVAEGRKMFRDPTLFMDGESCQTCHAEGAASPDLGTMTHDTQATGDGLAGMTNFNGPRDVPALWGLAQTAPYFWDGSIGTLNAAILRPVRGHMKDFVAADGKCSGTNSNTDDCNAEAARRVAALVAYVKTLDPPASAFDEGKLSDAALRGEKLFQGKGGCIECHGGPLFTDNLTHDTAVPQVKFKSPYRAADAPDVTSNDLGAPPPPPDPGCTGTPPPPGCDVGATPGAAFINTPQLRDLKDTGPYMHNGAFKTLEQVVGFYNGRYLPTDPPPDDTVPAPLANDPTPSVPKSNLSPLNLTDDEMRDLVAYLESL
jgi:cytochrome c peroxidase